jgi:group I intron endonuclease
MGVIYKTTCLITNEIYVGMDSKNDPNYLGSGLILESAIKKYGKSNFVKEILESCETRQQLSEREKYWIKEFNCIAPNGYNISTGGTGGDNFTNHPNKIEILSNFIKIQKEIHNREAYRKKMSELKVGVRRPELSEKFRGKGNPMYGATGRNCPTSKPIIQLSIYGDFIKEWSCSKQIERELGFRYQHIGEVCRNERKSSYGFIWKFAGVAQG